jgi:hypothetical protein
MGILLFAALFIILLGSFLMARSVYLKSQPKTPYATVFAILAFVLTSAALTFLIFIIMMLLVPFER